MCISVARSTATTERAVSLSIAILRRRRRKTFLIWYLKSQKVVPQSLSECDESSCYLEPVWRVKAHSSLTHITNKTVWRLRKGCKPYNSYILRGAERKFFWFGVSNHKKFFCSSLACAMDTAVRETNDVSPAKPEYIRESTQDHGRSSLYKAESH